MHRYIISDLHFGHLNILTYEPIRLKATCIYMKEKLKLTKTLEELIEEYNTADIEVRKKFIKMHDELLINNWNKVVKSEDQVFILGDFTLSRSKESIKNLVDRLNGNKVLIMGNHDTRKPKDYITLGFTNAIRKEIYIDDGVVAMHEPEAISSKYINKDTVYLFGHVHGKLCQADTLSNFECVCVERLNLTPIDLDQLIIKIRKRISNWA